MTFRIFQVSADGVASPVYKRDAPQKPRPSAATTGAVESTPAEWHELRERLRQQTTPKPPRKTRFGR